MEAPTLFEPAQFVGMETQVLQIIQNLLQAGGEQEIAVFGQSAHEKLEHRGVVHVFVEVRLQHRQLVQVGQQGAVSGVLQNQFSTATAPAAIISAMAFAPSSGFTLTARIPAINRWTL